MRKFLKKLIVSAIDAIVRGHGPAEAMLGYIPVDMDGQPAPCTFIAHG